MKPDTKKTDAKPAPPTQDADPPAPTNPSPRPIVVVDAEAWAAIDAMMADQPYRVVAPIIALIQRTGGVRQASVSAP